MHESDLPSKRAGKYQYWFDEVASAIHTAATHQAKSDDGRIDREEWPTGTLIPIDVHNRGLFLARKAWHWYSGATGKKFASEHPAIELRRPASPEYVRALIAAQEATERVLRVAQIVGDAVSS